VWVLRVVGRFLRGGWVIARSLGLEEGCGTSRPAKKLEAMEVLTRK
jgi:hypothetical protein